MFLKVIVTISLRVENDEGFRQEANSDVHFLDNKLFHFFTSIFALFHSKRQVVNECLPSRF